jgi:DNA polymerase III subunit epsilon
MIYLVFDTETTGLTKKNLPADHPDQPRVVQLAGELFDDDKTLSLINLLVNPGVPVPEEASKVHGITTADAQRFGVPSIVALGMFHNLVKLADVIIAHNAAYDLSVLNTEYLLAKKEALFAKKKVICTMLLTTDICQIPKTAKQIAGGYGGTYKWPNLDEAFRVLVDPKGFIGAHDALADIKACKEIFHKLQERNLVK